MSSSVFAKQEGGGDSGGGSVIRFKGQSHFFLLDRLSRDETLSKRSNLVNRDHLPAEVPDLRSQPKIGPLLPKDQLAFDFALEKLDAWKKILLPIQGPSAALMDLIANSIRQMSYLRTTQLFNVIPAYELSPALKRKRPEIWLAILYQPLLGSIISAPVWDLLDRETQAGLIIHEGLRQIQGVYLFRESNLQIQMMTAFISRENLVDERELATDRVGELGFKSSLSA